MFSILKIENFNGKILIFLIILLAEAVLTSTHNLCYGSKIRIINIPLQTPFFYIKVGRVQCDIALKALDLFSTTYHHQFNRDTVDCFPRVYSLFMSFLFIMLNIPVSYVAHVGTLP